MVDKNVALGIGLAAGVGLLLYTARSKGTSYPPYVPPVGGPPAPLPDPLPDDEPPVIPPGEVDPPPGQLHVIEFGSLLVTPSQVILGETVEISVIAGNISSSHQSYTLFLGPDTGITQEIELDSGEQIKYTWQFTPTNLGKHSVWAGERHNMFEVIEEERPPGPEPPPDTPEIPGNIIYTVASWTVYDDDYGRGRVYRTGLGHSVVEFWIESDGVHRAQLIGTTPFGVWPEHHVHVVGTLRYDAYSAMFAYMDDGYPEGYRSYAAWKETIQVCNGKYFRGEDTGGGFCNYSPYTYNYLEQ